MPTLGPMSVPWNDTGIRWETRLASITLIQEHESRTKVLHHTCKGSSSEIEGIYPKPELAFLACKPPIPHIWVGAAGYR